MKPTERSSQKLFAADLQSAVAEAVSLRLTLRARLIRDITDVHVMEQLEHEARTRLALPILVSNAMLGSYLAHGADSFEHSALLAVSVGEALNESGRRLDQLGRDAERDLNVGLPDGKSKRRPFHWPLEFPEVFGRGQLGFDAFVGNPPFLGSQIISGVFGANYKSYLAHNLAFSERAATADLVVFFFLRMIGLLHPAGYLGFLARRSLAEGKNREIGLDKIVASGATIIHANSNMPWPGKASVVVHQVHFARGAWSGQIHLNGEIVSLITAYLDSTSLSAPHKLLENQGLMFQGTILNGEGFKLSPQQAEKLLAENPKYKEVIFPFIGGNEINSDPFHKPSCWVINFWDWAAASAEEYSSAYSLVEANVKPERRRKKPNGDFQLRKPLPERWWQHGEKRPALYHALGRGDSFDTHPELWKPTIPKKRVLVVSRGVTKYPAFTFLDNKFIFSEKLYVLALENNSVFSVLSSDLHIVWAWMQKTSLGADLSSLSYTHGNIFETFPFPDGVLNGSSRDLESLGAEFFRTRQEYMEVNRQGLTKFYNDFHNPQKADEVLEALRALQSAINKAVASAYGWQELDVMCEFQQVGYLPTGANIRFSIAEPVRLEVLRRLSKLNAERRTEQGGVDQIESESDVAPFELELVEANPTPRRKRR